MKKIIIPFATLAVSTGIALGGAGSAQADDPGLCVDGVFVEGCVSGPGWVEWNPWNNWNNGWCNPGTGASMKITAGSMRGSGARAVPALKLSDHPVHGEGADQAVPGHPVATIWPQLHITAVNSQLWLSARRTGA